VGIALAATVSPFVRLRHAPLEQRQQIKWFAYAVAILIIGRLMASPATEAVGTGWIWSMGFAIYLIGIVGVPLAVGIAILRHHLYDIDLIIRRTLVYGSLTVLLAAVYFGGVALIGSIFQALTLREEEPQFVIVVTTLAIAALFNPLRRRIQWLIDRRFYRRRYDANMVLHTFSVRLRDETDLDRLTRELEGVVGQTMEPAHLSLWLRTRADSSNREVD
jgi:cytochrome b subunit of formate dehydrogenase